jgi:hypothetical protein
MQRIKHFIPSSLKQKLKLIAGYEPIAEHMPASLNPAIMKLAEQQRYGYAKDHFKESLENPGHPRENAAVIAGADWVHGQQAARIWRLRAGHG